MALRFGLLGPVAATVDDAPIELGGLKRRALLATLVLKANRVVSRDDLIDAIWGEEPPDTARNTLQVYISQLRKLLPDGVLETASRVSGCWSGASSLVPRRSPAHWSAFSPGRVRWFSRSWGCAGWSG